MGSGMSGSSKVENVSTPSLGDSTRSDAEHAGAMDLILRRTPQVIFHKYATIVLLVALCVIFTFTTSSFLTAENISSLLVTQTVSAAVSFAAMFPLIAGEFDLSLGYMVGVLIVFGAIVGEHGFGTIATIVAVLLAGLLLGLINGLLTVRLKISSFIATLGSGIVLSGITEGLSGGQVLYQGIPMVLIDAGRNKFLGIQIQVWLVALIAIIVLYCLEYTPFGRRLYATGGSERAAFLAGVRTSRLKIASFVVAGLLVAGAALFQLGSAAAADPTFGPDLLLPAYAAVFLGVTTHRPGYYNLVGTVVAILVLAVGFNGLSLLGVPYWVQPLFNGAVLLVAVMIARREARSVRVA